jgi:hypothetical protein
MDAVHKSGIKFRLIGLTDIRRLDGWREEVSLVTRTAANVFGRPASAGGPAAHCCKEFRLAQLIFDLPATSWAISSTRHRCTLLGQANFPDL